MRLADLSLRAKIAALVAGLTLAALAAGFALEVALETPALRRDRFEHALTQARLAADSVEAQLAFGYRAEAERTLARLERLPDVEAAAVYDADGALFAAYAPSAAPPDRLAAPAAESSGVVAGAVEVLTPVGREGSRYGTLYLRSSLAPLRRRLREHVAWAVLIAAVVGLMAAALAWALAAAISAPILSLATLARRISREGDYSPRIGRGGADEVGTLAASFDAMLEAVSSRDAALRELAGSLEGRVRERTAELERANERLAESEERYRVLFEESPVALMVQDWSRIKAEVEELRRSGKDPGARFRDQPRELARAALGGVFLSCNAACRGLHRAAGVEEMPKALALFTEKHPPPYAPAVAAFAEGAAVFEGEGRMPTLAESSVDVFVRASLVPGHEADWGKVLLGCVDITGRKAAEEEVRRLNRELERRLAEVEAANRELESFSYSVSHDLRAPLRVVGGFCAALEERHAESLGAEARTLLGRARSRCEEMGRLIDSLLALSQLGRKALELEEVDLSGLAGLAAERLRASAPERKASFRVEKGLKARGDAALLAALIGNLVSNAWKFTARSEEAVIEFGALQRETGPAYFVRDNGVGFDMEHAGQLFQPFRRLHSRGEYPGTGIGLAMAARIVGRHGGRIWAEGAPGQGATFYFTLGTAEEER